MPFIMQAIGRLASEAALSLGASTPWVRFTLLDSRPARRGEASENGRVTEAATFKAFGDLAERFCERVEKGQMVYAWGTQETQTFTGHDNKVRTESVYILSHFELGPRPYASRQAAAGAATGQREGGGYERRGEAPARPQPANAHRHAVPARQQHSEPPPHLDDDPPPVEARCAPPPRGESEQGSAKTTRPPGATSSGNAYDVF